MTNLTNYQWRQMSPDQLTNDLRDVWTLVTSQPGISVRTIAAQIGVTDYRARLLVNVLLESGTLTREGDMHGTLRVTVPMITLKEIDYGN